ncbi:hypothetical protein PMIT1320_00651 [Prochlorococcus marinus str. MIT 1320]|nr:hypothetical protein PMIT1320_00651 [Prochlorococcus marinus str. MIT 1320]
MVINLLGTSRVLEAHTDSRCVDIYCLRLLWEEVWYVIKKVGLMPVRSNGPFALIGKTNPVL